MDIPAASFMKTVLICTTLLFPLGVHADNGDAIAIQAALASPQRNAGDSDRDVGRKPAEVLAYLGVKPGMTVMDVMASGGWYTEVLSLAVGKEGKVYAQNTPAFLQFSNGTYEKAISTRLAENRLPNVERLNADFNAMGKLGEIDVAITALNFHDIYNRSPEAAISMLKNIKDTLKPGGVFGLIDHNGDAGADNNKLHRMTMQQAVDAAKSAGFEVASSDLLTSAEDDHTMLVFSPELRGHTDRFLLKLTNPQK